MRVTEVRLRKPAQDVSRSVLAHVSLVFDDAFAVHDLRLLVGRQGVFVAMPDKEMSYRCQHCQKKNPYRARYCMHCGILLEPIALTAKRFEDVANPITSEMREHVEQAIKAKYDQQAMPTLAIG